MPTRKIFSYAGIFLLVVASGCASIVSKSQYPVTINSEPDRAHIRIVDEAGTAVYEGETPATVTLSTKRGYFKGKDYTVTFSKDGYAEHSAGIKRTADGWYILGNIVVGGLIGWFIVDPATGAMWTLEKEMTETLSPSSVSSADGALHVVNLEDVPESLRDRMVRVN